MAPLNPEVIFPNSLSEFSIKRAIRAQQAQKLIVNEKRDNVIVYANAITFKWQQLKNNFLPSLRYVTKGFLFLVGLNVVFTIVSQLTIAALITLSIMNGPLMLTILYGLALSLIMLEFTFKCALVVEGLFLCSQLASIGFSSLKFAVDFCSDFFGFSSLKKLSKNIREVVFLKNDNALSTTSKEKDASMITRLDNNCKVTFLSKSERDSYKKEKGALSFFKKATTEEREGSKLDVKHVFS